MTGEEEIIIVQGISQKGRLRVYDHGNKWIVLENSKTKLKLLSVRTNYIRWMNGFEDKDFKICT